MCRRSPSDCSGDRSLGGGPFRLSDGDLDQLVAINKAVNARIEPAKDLADHWSPRGLTGDCEDYALAKRKALIDQGWAPAQVLIAVVEDAFAGPHAVLIARTDRGDLVLDNLTDDVLLWNQAGLTFISRQSEKMPAMWVRL